MPEVESEKISVNVTLPEGTPYARALEILAQLQQAEEALEEEANQISDGSLKLVENWYTRARPGSVLALVRLTPAEMREMSAKQAADRLRELIGDIPDAENLEVGYTLNQKQPEIELAINHKALDVLRAEVDDIKNQLGTYETVFNISDEMQTAME